MENTEYKTALHIKKNAKSALRDNENKIAALENRINDLRNKIVCNMAEKNMAAEKDGTLPTEADLTSLTAEQNLEVDRFVKAMGY